jgi:type I restriction enzyme, S subunit
MEVVGRSEIVPAGREPSVEIRRVLEKLERTPVVAEMITAFRDGQVTTRTARGKDGFTNSWTDNARVQGVQVGDVVVHGLDGFSGAIGDSEADGVCSPVYHVCQPMDGGDPAFYGRLLRRLALTGYLGNFAISTRERAVDFRNWDLFGRIPIPFVSIEQQREIGSRIRTLRPLIDLVEKSEVLAVERKSALITQAATGENPAPSGASAHL